jgi:hypothetical protein
MPGIGLDERERDSEMGLTPAGRGELGGVRSTPIGRAPRLASQAEK